MMRQHTTYKRILLVCIAASAAFFSHLFIEYKITSRYQELVNNDEIIEAFLSNDAKAIRSVVVRYGLEYQQVQHGKIVSSTSSNLPMLHIIPVNIVFAKGALIGSSKESLATLAPLSFIRRGRIYAGATLFSHNIDSPGYIVYTQVLP